MPQETADEAALATLSDWSALPVFSEGSYRQRSSEDRLLGDIELTALLENGNHDMNNFVCASTDADAADAQLVRFTFDLEQCPEPYVRGFVTERFEGSGRLARIWMTAMSLKDGPADQEMMRIYVDDDRVPIIQAPLAELLDGSAGEIFAPPFGAGSSQRMAWYYPVVFSSKLIIAIDRLGPMDLYYHQVDVVLDAAPSARSAAASRLATRDDAKELLLGPPPTGNPQTTSVTLAPTESVSAVDVVGPATIEAVHVSVPEALLDALADVVLTVVWDGAPQPAIELPLIDLFAAGRGVPDEPSLALAATREGGMVDLALRLPMPFETRAEWTLTNNGSEALDLDLTIQLTDGVPASSWGHFYVQRFETLAPASGSHAVASAVGPGRLVGVCLMMEGHLMESAGTFADPLNFLEGDELVMVDGIRAISGTGTEDYLNGAFYFEDGPSGDAFAQVWGIVRAAPGAPDHGQVSACRWHLLGDTVDFASSLEFDLEIGPDDPSLLDRYRSVAFLYGHGGS